MIEIVEAVDAPALETARSLFREYQQSLGIDLGFQDFETELRTLPGEYARPGGRLLLALDDGDAAGCVAMRPLEAETCEMKRLYVRASHRATGLGRRLAERIIAEARAAGYRRMVLDTLPSMGSAQRLYESLGFAEIAPYRHNPVPGARFLALDL
jgi:GNAT superfamily N-acetyltransferase